MRCSYIAVQGASKNVVLQQLGLVDGELADPIIWNSLRICDMPGGWLILLTSTIEWASEKRTRALSGGGALAIGTCMTTVAMGVEAYAYESGMLKWRIKYDPDQDEPLEMSGDLPAELAAIHAAWPNGRRKTRRAASIPSSTFRWRWAQRCMATIRTRAGPLRNWCSGCSSRAARGPKGVGFSRRWEGCSGGASPCM